MAENKQISRKLGHLQHIIHASAIRKSIHALSCQARKRSPKHLSSRRERYNIYININIFINIPGEGRASGTARGQTCCGCCCPALARCTPPPGTFFGSPSPPRAPFSAAGKTTAQEKTRREEKTQHSSRVRPSVSQSVIAQLDDVRMSDEGTIEGGIEGGERTSTW